MFVIPLYALELLLTASFQSRKYRCIMFVITLYALKLLLTHFLSVPQVSVYTVCHSFIRSQAVIDPLPFSPASIGVESLVVAAATFKRVKNTDESLRRDKERIIQLALLAVRKRYRKLGVGRQLLNVRNFKLRLFKYLVT